MPHVPDLRAHERHDPELIAAHAAGDLEGAALATATDLLATCPACAELHADLRAIAAVLPAVPAPPRTRDFRITPEQAARLRPTGWRGVLAAFASPRLSFAAPLGTGLAALGIAGLLLASAPGAVPAFEPSAAQVRVHDRELTTYGMQEGYGAASAAPSGAGAPVSGEGPSMQPAASPQAGNDTQGEGGAAGGKAPADALAAEVEAARVRHADETLTLLGGVLVVAGVGLVGLRWSARRFG